MSSSWTYNRLRKQEKAQGNTGVSEVVRIDFYAQINI